MLTDIHFKVMGLTKAEFAALSTYERRKLSRLARETVRGALKGVQRKKMEQLKGVS